MKLLTVKQILLVSTLGNVRRTVWRTFILILEYNKSTNFWEGSEELGFPFFLSFFPFCKVLFFRVKQVL